MQTVLWIVAIAVIAGTALAALGGFSTLEDDDEFASRENANKKIPLALFGYRKDVVDRLLKRDSQ